MKSVDRGPAASTVSLLEIRNLRPNPRPAREGDYQYAFFGTRDHYKKSGAVNVDTWRKMFGDTYQEYEGTHFMEEEYVYSLLVPKILEILSA